MAGGGNEEVEPKASRDDMLRDSIVFNGLFISLDAGAYAIPYRRFKQLLFRFVGLLYYSIGWWLKVVLGLMITSQMYVRAVYEQEKSNRTGRSGQNGHQETADILRYKAVVTKITLSTTAAICLFSWPWIRLKLDKLRIAVKQCSAR